MAFTLPPLPYAHDALEPHIDTLTMQIHHGKHHQAYVDNLNKAIAGTGHENKSLEDLVESAGAISPAVRNNGGGHWNHTFFWNSLAPNAGGVPAGHQHGREHRAQLHDQRNRNDPPHLPAGAILVQGLRHLQRNDGAGE